MAFTKYFTIETMKKLDLFDDLPYKYIKDVINNDDDGIDVSMLNLECENPGYCKTRFAFKIDSRIDGGVDYGILNVDFQREYSSCGYYALLLIDLQTNDDVGDMLSDADTVMGEEEEEDEYFD
tara:strand:+ start:174 stop:542 length:369 start_codon:yes stop_codon:yes gene_type:complete